MKREPQPTILGSLWVDCRSALPHPSRPLRSRPPSRTCLSAPSDAPILCGTTFALPTGNAQGGGVVALVVLVGHRPYNLGGDLGFLGVQNRTAPTP
jgi:hypothetical protein